MRRKLFKDIKAGDTIYASIGCKESSKLVALYNLERLHWKMTVKETCPNKYSDMKINIVLEYPKELKKEVTILDLYQKDYTADRQVLMTINSGSNLDFNIRFCTDPHDFANELLKTELDETCEAYKKWLDDKLGWPILQKSIIDSSIDKLLAFPSSDKKYYDLKVGDTVYGVRNEVITDGHLSLTGYEEVEIKVKLITDKIFELEYFDCNTERLISSYFKADDSNRLEEITGPENTFPKFYDIRKVYINPKDMIGNLLKDIREEFSRSYVATHFYDLQEKLLGYMSLVRKIENEIDNYNQAI